MNRRLIRAPRCIVIAGPNGAGKTTFAREFLPKDARVVHFVNADLIASGLSPLRPELAALAGGRLFLAELDRLARARADFVDRLLYLVSEPVQCRAGVGVATGLEALRGERASRIRSPVRRC